MAATRRTARSLQRLDRLGIDFFNAFVEQLANKPDRSQSDGQKSGQRPGSDYGHQQQIPDQQVNRSGGHNDQQSNGLHKLFGRLLVADGASKLANRLPF